MVQGSGVDVMAKKTLSIREIYESHRNGDPNTTDDLIRAARHFEELGSPDFRVERGMTMQVQKPEFHVERTTP